MNTITYVSTLQKLYNLFNSHFFNDKLPEVMIVLQSVGKTTVTGYCTTNEVWEKKDDDNTNRYEIAITTEYLDRSVYDISETLLHEMCHLDNVTKGIKDCSGSGKYLYYHNVKFRNEADAHGLIATKNGKYGWGHTIITEETRKYIDDELIAKSLIDPLAFDAHRKIFVAPAKKSKKTYTYKCPVCGAKLRAESDDLIIRCVPCGVDYELSGYNKKDDEDA